MLETPDASPTLIKIDLLEAVAFLAAWSLLLITLTTKVVNKGRNLEFAIDEGIRKSDDLKADLGRINEGLLDAQREAGRVAEENEQLRGQLAARPAEELEEGD